MMSYTSAGSLARPETFIGGTDPPPTWQGLKDSGPWSQKYFPKHPMNVDLKILDRFPSQVPHHKKAKHLK